MKPSLPMWIAEGRDFLIEEILTSFVLDFYPC